jgi:hypothetical protein
MLAQPPSGQKENGMKADSRKTNSKLGIVAGFYNPSTWEAATIETLSQTYQTNR